MGSCKKRMAHRITGYLLLLIGLAVLFFAFNGMYQTFVHKKPVVQVLQLKPWAINTQYGAVQVDANMVNEVLNLSLFALFMIFLAGLGGKVAGIGCNLLKTERLCDTLRELKREDVLQKEEEIKKL